MSLLFALLFNLCNLVFFSLSFLVTLRSPWQPRCGLLICWNLPINVKSIFYTSKWKTRWCFDLVCPFVLSIIPTLIRWCIWSQVSTKCVCNCSYMYNTLLAIFGELSFIIVTTNQNHFSFLMNIVFHYLRQWEGNWG